MKQLIFASALALAGCASAPEIPEQSLQVDDKVHAMSRTEVMLAIQECQTVKTRALMIFAKRKVGGVYRDIVVDVTCAPLY